MKHKMLFSIAAMLVTSMVFGVTLNFTPVGVPPDSVPPDGRTNNRNANVVSDGTYIYYTPGNPESGPNFYRILGGNSDSTTWANLTALLGNAGGVQDGGPDGLWYDGGNIYGWETANGIGDGWRDGVVYSISGDSWTGYPGGNNAPGNPQSAGGANAAPVIDDSGNLYGFWKGWNQVENCTNIPNMVDEWQIGLDAGTSHSVDSTRDDSYIYIVAHKNAGGNASLYRFTADGSASTPGSEWKQAPWNIGLGCAITYLPGAVSESGQPELWVLRGTDVDAGDGNAGNPTSDLGIFNLTAETWSTESLPLLYGEGSDIERIGSKMYFLNGIETSSSNMMFATIIPEPGLLSGLAIAVIFFVRKIRK